MRTGKKLLALLLTLSMALSLTVTAAGAEENGGVTILYTNDIHTYIDQDLTYSLVAAYKDSLENALLVDAGDHIQGTAYGGMDQGATIIQLMNAAGYDLATLGNHEFDYDMEGCMAAIQAADFPYVSCNFYHEADGVRGENVLDSYEVFELGGVSVAKINYVAKPAHHPCNKVGGRNIIYAFSRKSQCDIIYEPRRMEGCWMDFVST